MDIEQLVIIVYHKQIIKIKICVCCVRTNERAKIDSFD
jgi:hypothetical protein